MKRFLFGMFICMLSSMASYAQIGYQVSLLSSATGEPRANETVSASIVITDSKGNTVYSATQSATTNDFGVLSLVVGDANTFKGVAIGRLPLYISVTVGGTLVGKSQILNVPVAEVANTLKSDFTLDELCGRAWGLGGGYTITFSRDGKFTEVGLEVITGTYDIEGNTIYCYFYSGYSDHDVRIYRFKNSALYQNH